MCPDRGGSACVAAWQLVRRLGKKDKKFIFVFSVWNFQSLDSSATTDPLFDLNFHVDDTSVPYECCSQSDYEPDIFTCWIVQLSDYC
jgi:hypothetical protein